MLTEESRNFMVCLTTNVTVLACIKKAAVLNFGRDKRKYWGFRSIPQSVQTDVELLLYLEHYCPCRVHYALIALPPDAVCYELMTESLSEA
jgi:hypothetical protein